MATRHRFEPAPTHTLKLDPLCWQNQLVRLAAPIRKRYADWTWTKGGCFAFAEAFQKAFGGVLYGVCEYDPDGKDWPVNHAVVRLHDHFFDFEGPHDEAELLRQYKSKRKTKNAVLPNNNENVFWFEDDFLNDEQWTKLHEILLACAVGSTQIKRPRSIGKRVLKG